MTAGRPAMEPAAGAIRTSIFCSWSRSGWVVQWLSRSAEGRYAIYGGRGFGGKNKNMQNLQNLLAMCYFEKIFLRLELCSKA